MSGPVDMKTAPRVPRCHRYRGFGNLSENGRGRYNQLFPGKIYEFMATFWLYGITVNKKNNLVLKSFRKHRRSPLEATGTIG